MTKVPAPNLLAKARTMIDGGLVDPLQQLIAQHPELCESANKPAETENNLLLHLCNWPGGKPNGAVIAGLLIDSGISPNTRFRDDGETVLHWAASNNNDSAILDVLLARGANIDALGGVIRGTTPLANAVYFGLPDIAALLVERGAAVHNMLVAAGLGRIDLLSAWHQGNGQFLGDAARIDPNSPSSGDALLGQPAAEHWTFDSVIAALCCEQYHVVDWFLERGFNIDVIPAQSEWSCLHHAAYTGSLSMAMYLLANGASLTVQSRQHGATPMHFACAHGNPEVMNYLIDCGAPLTLGEAAYCGRLDKIIESAPTDQDTPMLLAQTVGTQTQIGKPIAAGTRQARLTVAKYLLQRTPDLGTRVFAGKSAIELAEQAGDEQIIALLRPE